MTTTMTGMAAANGRLRDENAALRAAVSRIQHLHHIHDLTTCFECGQPWPCNTITALSR